MDNARRNRNNRHFHKLAALLAAVMVISTCVSAMPVSRAAFDRDAGAKAGQESFALSTKSVSLKALKGKKIRITYIDVGQGDSTLIELPDKKNILIDAGEYTAEDDVIGLLNKRKVKKIDYLIATHPDSDHIGSMQYVIREFRIGRMYMPDAPKNTKTYEFMMNAIKEKNVKVKNAHAGMSLFTGKYRKKLNNKFRITARFLAPAKGRTYSDTNNYSTVLRLKFKKRRFLFTGDAETLSEGEMVAGQSNGTDRALSADVLKVGHHGSYTATSAAFLTAVNPKVAVISCGKGNRYGHPHEQTLQRLKEYGVTILRTDINGDITLRSNGKKIVYSTEK